MLYIFPCWHRMVLRTEGVTAAIRRAHPSRPCTARALQDRSQEPARPCVNITYDSAVICAGQYEAALIYLHDTRQMGLFRLMCYPCAGHITLQLVADRRWTPFNTVSPLFRPRWPLPLVFVVDKWKYESFLVFARPFPAALAWTVIALQRRKDSPCGYQSQALNLPCMDFILK